MENSPLKDHISIFKGIIPNNICSFILNKLTISNWVLHSWTYYDTVAPSPDINTELSVTSLHPHSVLQLKPIVIECVDNYRKNKKFDINGYTNFRANKYDVGTSMKLHTDHITTIFDGHKKGIPVLSIVCLLNDNFEGGEFTFFENYEVDLKQGDIMIFPSVFLYPHQVKKVTKGTRYSIVQWAF